MCEGLPEPLTNAEGVSVCASGGVALLLLPPCSTDEAAAIFEYCGKVCVWAVCEFQESVNGAAAAALLVA